MKYKIGIYYHKFKIMGRYLYNLLIQNKQHDKSNVSVHIVDNVNNKIS